MNRLGTTCLALLLFCGLATAQDPAIREKIKKQMEEISGLMRESERLLLEITRVDRLVKAQEDIARRLRRAGRLVVASVTVVWLPTGAACCGAASETGCEDSVVNVPKALGVVVDPHREYHRLSLIGCESAHVIGTGIPL